MTTYKIVRFFRDDHQPEVTIETGLTLEQAQAHCNDPASRGGEGGGAWFDGYRREED